MDGGCVAMANLMEVLLTNNHNVKHLTIETNKHSFNHSNYSSEIALKTNPEAIKIDTDIKISAALPYLFKNDSYNVQRFYSAEMASKIVETLQSFDFDCVILESLFSTPYLNEIRQNFGGKVFLRAHNVEFKIWEDLTANCRNWLKSLYFKKLTANLKRYELQIIPQLDGILTISEEDAAFFKSVSANPVKTIPFAIESNTRFVNDYSAANLFHVGGMDWEPNRQAVERLIRLFPAIKQLNPAIELFLIGKGTNELSTNNASIHSKGFVEHLEEQCISTGILVSPLTSGSGIRIKIIEMMALGIPVITTTKGAQGILYTEKKCIFIADTDEEIVNACHQLSTHKELRIEIGTNAKKYISNYHSPVTVGQQLNEFLQST